MTKRKINFLKFLLVALTIGIALVLRIVFVKYGFSFSSELAGDLTDFKNSIIGGNLPLLGPHSGTHPWLYFSPVYYWLFIPVVKIFGFAPEVFAATGIIFSIITLAVNYFVAKKLKDFRFAIISTLIMAISPLWIDLAKDARFYALATLFFYPFIVSLKAFWDRKIKSIFWPTFWLTLALTFHYSVLTIYPVLILIILLRKQKLSFKGVLGGVAGFILPFTPFILSGIGIKMLSNLFVWVPYRMAGFGGLYPKNNLSWTSFGKSLEGIVSFIGKTILFTPKLNILLGFVLAVVLIVGIIKILQDKKKDFWQVVALSFLICGFGAAVIHGGFIPVHYFIFLAPIMIWIVAYFVEKIITSKILILISPFLVFCFAVIFSNVLYLGKVIQISKINQASLSPHFVPLALQKSIANYVVNNAGAEKFTLARVGPFDYYGSGYLQNYVYLMWLKGVEPSAEAQLHYTIFEDTSQISKINKGTVYFVENVGILKEK